MDKFIYPLGICNLLLDCNFYQSERWCIAVINNRDCPLPLISILTPAYNSSKYILDAVNSVVSQTYSNWEMLIIDDCSTDGTYEIAEKIADDRIIVLSTEKNSGGGAVPRNLALERARGRFVTFLDSDDLFLPQKLEKQVSFMLNNNIGFSCASYEVIDDSGNSLGKKIYMKDKLDYRGYMLNHLLQTSAVMIDLEKVSKDCAKAPNIPTEDLATWGQILKSGHDCYGMREVLAKYRRTKGSISSNKFRSMKSLWNAYRNVQKLPFLFSSYCFLRNALLAIWKRIYW